jgi:hypothetical protein
MARPHLPPSLPQIQTALRRVTAGPTTPRKSGANVHLARTSTNATGADVSTPASFPATVGTPPSPVIASKLDKFLRGYPLRKNIIDGFTFGFPLHFDGADTNLHSRNSSSATSNPEHVEAKLQTEVALGRIAGPFHSPPLDNFKSSPLALREKHDSGRYRLLHNLSFPYDDRAVNFNIPRVFSTVHYASLATAITHIQDLSPGVFLAKSDISDAFRLIPLHPSNYHLTGFQWRNSYWVDLCLPMGCASSCQTFESFSSALAWILTNKLGVGRMVKVLDDFLFLANTESDCRKHLNSFLTLCREVGVPVSREKTLGPMTTLTFLGIELNTLTMRAQLPLDKLQKYSAKIYEILQKRRVTLRDIKSVTGMLQFSTSVVSHGRAFLRRMHDATIGVKKPHHFVRITHGIRHDLTLWHAFLSNYNGVTIISRPPVSDSVSLHLYSDASKQAFGATFASRWIRVAWPERWQSLSITVLELYPILTLVATFASDLSHTHVVFHCDNQAVVAILNKQSSKCKSVMSILRPLILLLLQHNVSFRAVHIPGVDNIVADALSRFQETPDLLRRSGMQRSPTIVPSPFLPDNFPIIF